MARPQPSPKSAVRGYFAWGTAELFFIISVLLVVMFAVLSPGFAKGLGLTEAQLGVVGGTYLIAFSVGQLVLGSMMDRFSPRLILGGTALVSAAGCALLAVSNSMATALAAQALMGLGFSTTFVGVIFVVGRDFPERFAFMSALSQSLSNIAGALIALAVGVTAAISVVRGPFLLASVVLLAVAVLLVLFIGAKPGAADGAGAEQTPPPFLESLKICAGSLQFWMAAAYYGLLFGILLAYSNLWNVQFQTTFFGHSGSQASLLNAMIPLGVTVGSIAAGVWAQGRGDFVLPARAFGVFTVLIFGVMFLVHLSEAEALAMNFAIGLGVGGSILALTALQVHLPQSARAVATAVVVTTGFLMGGIVQPLIGVAVEAPIRTGSLLGLVLSETPDFGTYQKGMLWLIGYALLAAIASFFFRSAPSSK